MRRKRSPRSPLQRFALIAAALGTLLLGYWLGNRYQFGELEQTAAIMLAQPIQLDSTGLPPALAEQLQSADSWLILLPGEPGAACDRLLDHYIQVFSRLAARPQVQAKIRLALLDVSAQAPTLAWQGIGWADSYPLDQAQMLRTTGELGIAPLGTRWCEDVQATAALVGPQATAYALLPLDKPADIAESLRLIIEAFDPDV